MSSIGHQSQASVGLLTVRTTRMTARVGGPALRLRVERLLGGADLRPAGLAAGAELVVRNLRARMPLASATPAGDAWREPLHAQLEDILRHAARPANGPVSPDAPGVVFADRAEMLACLTCDLLAGRATRLWYWQHVLRGLPSNIGSAIAALWCAEAPFVPPALALLDPREVGMILQLWSPTQAVSVARALHHSFAIAEPALEAALAVEAPVPSGVLGVREADEASIARPVPLPPWRPWLPDDTGESTWQRASLQARYALGLAFTLLHAPAFARSAAFAGQAVVWLRAERNGRLRDAAQLSREAATSGGARRALPRATPPEAASGVRVQGERRPASGAQVWARHDASDVSSADIERGEAPAHAPGALDAERACDLPEAAPDSPQPGQARFAQHRTQAQRRSGPHLSSTSRIPDGGVETDLAGIMYLANLLGWLDLPNGWPTGALAEHLSGWAIVEALGRGLLGPLDDHLASDPVWGALAGLDGRADGERIGVGLRAEKAFRLPPLWLQRYGPQQPVWISAIVRGRLRLADGAAGYLVADVPLGDAPLDALVADELAAYRAAGVDSDWHATPSVPLALLKPHVAAMLSPDAAWWLRRALGFVRHLLSRALAVSADDPRAIGQALLRRHGRLVVGRTHVDVTMPLDAISLPARRAGLDRDPGWMPDLARIVLFHFE